MVIIVVRVVVIVKHTRHLGGGGLKRNGMMIDLETVLGYSVHEKVKETLNGQKHGMGHEQGERCRPLNGLYHAECGWLARDRRKKKRKT